MMRALRTVGLVLGGLLLIGSGCDEALQSPLVPPADLNAPAPVANLAVSAVGQSSVALTWSAPRARTESGRVARYEILYSTGDPDSIDWNAAARVAGPPRPLGPGATEHFTVEGLATLTSFHFALQSADDKGRRSALSNRASAMTDWFPQSQAELIEKLRAAYAGRNRAAFETLFPAAADSAPYLFFLNEPLGAFWSLTEELRIHRRIFEPQNPVPNETPVDPDLWLASIDIQLEPQTAWTERPDLYRSPSNPAGLDPARWRATDALYHAYVFWHMQGYTDYLVLGRQDFVAIEDLQKQPGEARRFLLYRWEDLGTDWTDGIQVEAATWGGVKGLYK